jgi:hypothetical protein
MILCDNTKHVVVLRVCFVTSEPQLTTTKQKTQTPIERYYSSLCCFPFITHVKGTIYHIELL